MGVEGPPDGRLPSWFGVAATLIGAVVLGGLLGVVYSAAAGGIGASPSASASGSASEPVATPSPANPFADVTPDVGTPPPSPSASPSPTPSAEPTHVTAVAEECFFEGLQQPAAAGEQGELVAADDLRARLPTLHSFFAPEAYVGSSLTSSLGGAYVNGFEACLGADPATIRWGTTRGSDTLGVILFGAQVDGYTGPELADVIVEGSFPPNDPATLRTAEHGGWSYRTNDGGFAVTASADTVYWMQQFCCVDPGPDAELPTFDEIIHVYLDAIIDEPA